MNGKSWSEEEVSFLIENKGKKSHREMAEILSRTESSVNRKVMRLGISKIQTGSRLIDGLKRCSKCLLEKPPEDFSDKHDRVDGKDPWCLSCHRDRKLKFKYDMTSADYDKRVANQCGKCFICKLVKPLVIDHCHDSGKIRNLLCSSCNMMLGMASDDPKILAMAVAYLKLHGKSISTFDKNSALSSEFLIARKKCCGNGCRNCPY